MRFVGVDDMNNEGKRYLIYFHYKEETIWLKEPLEFKIEREDDGVYVISNDNLLIHGTGKTLFEAQEMAEEVLSSMWEMFAICPIEELAEESISLRNKLLGMVKE